ncbi:MAG: DNA polymerase [Candidatus Jordarchaeales archaeon]
MDKHIVLPKYLRDGIKPLKQGYPKRVKCLVFDVETCDGEPYLLTFYDGERVSFLKVDKGTVLDKFIQYLLEHCTSKKFSYILFSHNLPFDLTAVFTKLETKIFRYRTATYVHFSDKTKKEPLAIIKLFTHKVWFAQIKLKNGVSIKVVDSNAFIKGSLYELSRTLKFKYVKRERPWFVEQGKKPKNREQWIELYRYCYDEIKAQFELAQYILNMHREYDTTFTVSIAQLASKIFRKHFLKEKIPQIPQHIKKLAELTIHGGRASVFVDTPCLIPEVKMYDYNSFYPFSMANLPNLTKGTWKETYEFDGEHEGFYVVSGFIKLCKYPIIIKSVEKMEFANGEYVSEIPIASYELREALRSGEFEPTKIHGYVWIPHSEAHNPFRDYVMHFYRLKETYEKDSPLYIQAKLLLNSLYGKTYQTLIHPKSEDKEDFRVIPELKKVVKIETLYKAGGLYLPHVGSWITSQCRAILHKDLHFYNGIDCATDSFKTTMDLPTSEKLGLLKKEHEGMLLLLRPKLYVMFSNERQKEIMQEGDLREYLNKELDSMEIGKDIVKYALHGFQGNVYTLLNLIAKNEKTYKTKHMVKIREAIRQHKQARIMETQTRTLNIPLETITLKSIALLKR